MVFDLVTTVESVERRPDGTHIVEVGLDEEGVMVPRQVQKVRGRARALIATGFVEASTARASDIAKAIKNLDFGEIKTNTEVIGTSEDEFGRTIIEVKVN